MAELSDFELNLVTFLDQQWNLTGELLTAEKAHSQFGIPVGKYQSALAKESFREALEERGITLRTLVTNEDWTSKSLTATQLAVANSMFDLTDSRSQKKKLADLGVETRTYQAWLKDPVFKDYLQKRAESIIGDNEHEINLALMDRVRSGDIKAIAYINEMTGRFVPENKKAVERANDPRNINIEMLITKIIEIVIEEVSSPEEARAIGTRLQNLIAARNVAGALLQDEEPIIVPEIAPIRSMDTIKELTASVDSASGSESGR